MNSPFAAARIDRLRPFAWAAVSVLIAAPWVAMQFTHQVTWTAFDFALFASLLVGAGAILEFALLGSDRPAFRAGAALALLAGAGLFLVTGAVGVIGDEGHPGNLMYLGVLALAAMGALLARFRPRGLSIALAAAAAAQVVAGAAALAAGWGQPVEVAAATAVFAALWLGAAALFRRAA